MGLKHSRCSVIILETFPFPSQRRPTAGDHCLIIGTYHCEDETTSPHALSLSTLFNFHTEHIPPYTFYLPKQAASLHFSFLSFYNRFITSLARVMYTRNKRQGQLEKAERENINFADCDWIHNAELLLLASRVINKEKKWNNYSSLLLER